MATALASAFSRIVHSRKSVGRFDPTRLVPLSLSRELVALTLRSPSGFNMQPYVIVMVEDERVRQRLSDVMLGVGNGMRVREAPLVAVFAADLESLSSVGEVQDMEARTGTKPASYIRSLPTSVAAFAGAGAAGCSGAREVGQFAVAGALAAISALTRVPLPSLSSSGMPWAYKQTALAAMTYMLAATSLGLETHPMEGFDSARVGEVVGLSPQRYSTSLVVATGYEASSEDGRKDRPLTPRRESVFRLNSANQPFPFTD